MPEEQFPSDPARPEALDLDFYRFILDSLPVAVVTVDGELRITSCNPWAEEMLGYDRNEVLGRLCGEVLRGGRCAGDCPLKTVLEQRSPVLQIETEIEHKSGRRIPVRMHTAGLFDHTGGLVGGLEAFVDLSARRALEQEKSNFISMLAHDMKSPVISIDGFAFRLLKESAGDERATRYLEVIRSEAKKLESLIDDFLESSRLQTGKLQLNFSATSLDRELQEIVERYGPRAQAKGIEIQLEIDEDFPVIQADTSRLHRVLSNLVDNAVKYSPDGGIVAVTTRDDGREVRVEVRDQGVGIDQEDLVKIFVPFQRGRKTDRTTGFGIGLASVKAIVESHRGQVLVESEPGKGSVFTIILPRFTGTTEQP